MGFDYQSLASGQIQMPDGWKLTTIEEVAKVNEKAITPKNAPPHIRYIDIASVDKGKLLDIQELSFKEAPSRARRVVRDKDSLISTVRPNLEHYMFVKEPELNTIASTGFAVVSAKAVDPRFLYYYMTSKPFTAYLTQIAESHTSAYPAFNPDVIEQAELLLPKDSEQRAIAHILGSLDDKIELNRRMNQTLEATARAIFKSWFVDFDPVRAKAQGRDPGLPGDIAALFPDSFEDSELGEIPKGWEVSSLGDFVTSTRGRSYKSAELQDCDTALVTLKSFERGGGYRLDGLKSYVGPYKPEQVVKPGELVIAQTDVTQRAEVIGKPAIVRWDHRYSVLVASLDTAIVRPKDADITTSFLYFLFMTDEFQSHTYAHSTGTTVLHLGKEALPSYQTIIPPREIIEIFDDVASSIFQKISLNEQESSTLAVLRDTLLPKLISGELQIPDAEKFVEEAGL